MDLNEIGKLEISDTIKRKHLQTDYSNKIKTIFVTNNLFEIEK